MLYADAALGAFPARRTAPDPARSRRRPRRSSRRTARSSSAAAASVIAGAEAELQALAELLEIAGRDHHQRPGQHRRGPPARGRRGRQQRRHRGRRARWSIGPTSWSSSAAAPGSVTTERWRHPAPGKVRVVHVDVDPAVIGANYPTEVAVVGDAKLALAALRDEVARFVDSPPDRSQRPRPRGGSARRAPQKFARVRRARALRRDADPARADRRRRCRTCCRRTRSSSPIPARPAPTSRPTTSSAGPAATSSATGRMARSAMRCRPRSAPSSAGPTPRCVAVMGDGSFGFAVGRARDDRPPRPAGHAWS